MRHPVVVDRSGLLYLANQGTVTFHAWTSRVPRLDQPDQMIFDLDPPEGDTQAARLAVRAVRDLLAELGVPSFPVATGSKGYHAVVPLRPSLPIERVEEVSRRLAALVVASHPDRLTLEFRIERREGRVFVDWLRNRYSATTVVPYSLRPRPGATVAVPIAWEELDEIEPDGCDLAGMTRRLEETDPWEDLEAAAVDLKVVAEEVAGRVAAAGIRLEPFDRFRS